MAAIEFRRAELKDLPTTHSLVCSAYGDATGQGWVLQTDIYSGDRVSLDEIVGYFHKPNAHIFLAESSHEDIIGVAGCQIQNNIAHLSLASVSPSCQGQGVFRSMHKFIELKAIQLGARQFNLEVLWMKDALISYYKRLGYFRVGTKAYREVKDGCLLHNDLYYMTMTLELVQNDEKYRQNGH
ncbi:hypothetical protein NLG97_g3896 [Lecanicillium saksenae]|uniref:Uncharacterized protein n=1 Tax=Lecanicillium saksenae TaxID=468837 RepID=A0ACC1QYL6_9HYPO|nr:hypothetical protein NLG97_g3896 [Lecanicillium saksenae]